MTCYAYMIHGCQNYARNALDEHHMTLISKRACKLQLTHQHYLLKLRATSVVPGRQAPAEKHNSGRTLPERGAIGFDEQVPFAELFTPRAPQLL